MLMPPDPSLSDYGKDKLKAHDIRPGTCPTYPTFNVFQSVSEPIEARDGDLPQTERSYS
ncbi:hypothetical protein V8C37DRAFT_381783 [Trichoderma ceciliae]